MPTPPRRRGGPTTDSRSIPISESFVVLLNPEGTRLLRSWRHVEHCPQCGGNQTAELSLDELRGASLA